MRVEGKPARACDLADTMVHPFRLCEHPCIQVSDAVNDMIERIPFGKTGHLSSRTLFGAAALGAMKQDRADRVLDLLLEYGVNHIDTAASYGDSELRVAPWMKQHRAEFFLATKTGERTRDGARDQLHRSLDRLGVDHVDLIQMHNLTDEAGWQTAMGDGGALEALVEARDAGLVRNIGVTGHGTFAPAMHLKSLAAFPFASILVPYNFSMLAQPEFAADLARLFDYCRSNEVAIQTIKSIALRRWTETDQDPHYSWYKPISDPDALSRAVQYVLRQPGLFLNTSSDAKLLETTLKAASAAASNPPSENLDDEIANDQAALGAEPLFVRGISDEVR